MIDTLVNDGSRPDNGVVKTVNAREEDQAEDVQSTMDKDQDVKENQEEHNKRAVKADDATVPEYLWNITLVPDGNEVGLKALGNLRAFSLR